ncbi:Lipopolysaccharide-responsive and beige-like anchor protein [Acipenser ruthenus]|uniref:Lipopolysaccharide-responsive and beige-like anchor protein n=1 Tax=Acipenser ruthenus TaxID=7906 RepID=A0A444UGK6_ACIRT|nr:Lipopolysaccharide-responsive and beige-like anchor protein [Acipenser ruthenus]
MASEEKPVPLGLQAGDAGVKDEGTAPLPLNPGVPIRGIKMKFAVLAGLVEVGEVTNRDIVETVLNLAIALPPIAKWPYQNGFTFHTWLRMDPVNNINVDKDKPYLYCFRTSKGLGYSAHFVGGCLIVTSIKSKGKGFQHCVKYDFKPQKWYMVTIVHIYNRWKNSEISCYVNGELASYGEITWLVNTSDTFDKCFLGSSETADANRVFCGQMGAVYLFSEAVSAAQILAIYQLGPGYKGTFKYKAESDLLFAEHHKLLLYEGKLSSCIAFMYNPRATDAQLCLESSPKDNPSIFIHSPHALMLQDVKAVVTHSVQSAIHSIGGVQVLFPLFAQLDYLQHCSDQVDTTVCSTLLAFVMELLKNSVAMQEQVLACKGFLVIGYSLEKSSKVHVTRAVLELFLGFARYLSNLQNGVLLLKQLCDHILFNPAIWIHAPAKVQLQLYTYLSTEFISTVTIYNAIRRVGTVLQVMHTLKYFYWVVNPLDRSGVTPKGLDGPRPNQKETHSLRAFLLLFVKQLIMKDYGVKEDELQSILNYLLTIHEDGNLMDVLQLLVALMSEHPGSMVPAFDQRNGIRVIYKLLASKSEGIRVQALKVLCYFLMHLGTNTQISSKLATKVATASETEILKVIAALLKNSPQCPESMDVRRVFLSDMIKLFNNSRDNRRSLLQCSVWQEWMLSLCYINPKNSEEQKITEMVYAIFRILLYHAVKYEWGGWRVWVDTLSITHSKVTFEQHKDNLAQKFREYQRQGGEASDLGHIGLIRTISGVSSDVEAVNKVEEQMSTSYSPEAVQGQNAEMVTSSETELKTEDKEHAPEPKAEEEKMEEPVVTDVFTLVTDSSLAAEEKVSTEQVECEKPIDKPTAKTLEESVEDPKNLVERTLKDNPVDETSSAEAFLEQVTSEASKKLEDKVSGTDNVEQKEESSGVASANEQINADNENHEDSAPAAEEQVTTGKVDDTSQLKDEEKPEDMLTQPKPVSDTSGSELHESGEKVHTQTEAEVNDQSIKEVEEKSGDAAKANGGNDADQGLAESSTSTAPTTTATTRTKEIKIARLDVSSVASDTERLELKASTSQEPTSPSESGQGQEAASGSSGQGRDSSARSTMFRVPEFRWSHMHQRLLTDLLFSIETDVQMWRSHSTKTVMDFVNSSENIIFVHNTIHLISQVVDNIIMACGGILPLLSAATSATHELENLEPAQGLSIEASVTFLQRLISLVDVLIFASSLSFTEIEAEKNISSGGILRQCLRLVDVVIGGISPIRDLDRLLQDMDINRLRAVVFRDIEDSKQAQFLALAVVYFISVLMVSKYRDILEPQNERKPPQRSQSVKSTKSGSDVAASIELDRGADGDNAHAAADFENVSSLRRRDSGIGEDQASIAASEVKAGAGAGTEAVIAGPDAISEVLSTLSSEVKKSQDSLEQENKMSSSAAAANQGKNVKDILRSLVSTPAEEMVVDPAFLPPAFLGAMGDGATDKSVQFRSFDRSVVVAPKKAGGAPSLPPSTVTAATPVPATAAAATPVNNVSVVSTSDSPQSTATEPAAGSGSASANLPSVPTVSPMRQDSASNMSISERLEQTLEKAAPLLREIFVDFSPFLSRTLLGSHGQELLIEGTSKSSISYPHIAEVLLIKCHSSQSAQYSAEKRDEEKMCDHLIRAAKYRDHVTATQLIQKIIHILTDKHGAWGSTALSRPREFWRLDYWEDDLRRRRRFVRNPFGSTHPEATLKAAVEHAPEEDVLVNGKQQSIRSQALANQNSESEILLDGDDDTISSLEDKELENLTGPVSLSTGAQLVAPAVVVKGTLSITASELYFEVDEEEPSFTKVDPKILAYTEGLHGKWLFTEIRAVFSRRYLLQNTALEIFMANRTAVMLNFPDQSTVKKVVHCLPRVGVGTNFGLPQTRRISLASPKQLYKASNMTQRWQRREISNFEYLIFLNTISGRTFNDLNQYPVFPWVITNYDSEELDLTLPSNFRDLSKPIGALNPKRAAFFSDRFESWEDDQVPKFHYGTHYSTSSFSLMWLLRIEPFTTFFLNLQGGKFAHADRTFSSVSRAWRNCQRDTSDVKELIPEFYYLPEMFVNSNNYNLGVMDDGTVVSDVELPPWAKTPEEFIRINRLALESEFVSCQLHQWIDLIFGYKQQGPEAVRALNVFYYLTYEGAVNLSSIADPAVEAQIRSFGQTPCQLLIEPHPPRSSAMQVYLLLQTPMMFTEQMQQDVIMVLKFPSNSPVAHVAANTQPGLAAPAIITVTANRLFAVNKWHGLSGHQGSVQDQPYQLPVEIDPVIASNVGTHRRQITDLLDQSIQIHSQCFVITADNRFILVCGFWDKSFRVYSTDSGKLTQIVFGHRDVVTCLARSESYIGGDCYFLSGSRDATLLLWYWNGKNNSIGENPGTEFVTPRAILTGHDCEITCATVCAELGLVISGSKEGPCLIHSMNGDLLRTLESPVNCVWPRLIQSSAEGHCVVYYEKGLFCIFSVNGKLLGHMEVEENVKAILLSRDGQYLLAGGDGGVLTVWQIHNLKQLFTYPGCDAGIRSMAMSQDQRQGVLFKDRYVE